MGTFIENPFLIAGYESPEYFCDRQKETAEVQDAIHNGRNIVLTSPRRMGKTGLILNLFYLMRKEMNCFYIDLSSTTNLSEFTKALTGNILGQLDSNPVKILKKAATVISGIRPSISIDELTGLPKIGIDIAPGEEEATLSQLFSYLKNSGKQCVIAIDEFQQITTYPEKNIEPLLRSHVQNIHNARFIFSGSESHLLGEMFLSPKRPFYQSSSLKSIGPIDESEYFKFASGFFEKAGRELPEDIFHEMYKKYEGHTWYIQKILNQLYSKPSAKISQDIAAESLRDILRENEVYYQTLMRIYTPSQRKLIKAIAREGKVKEITSGAFITKYGLTATSSVKGSLRKLLADEIVYHSLDGYMIYDRFFGQWLAMA